MRKLTASEIKLKKAVKEIRMTSAKIVDDLNAGKTVELEMLIDVLETQSDAIQTLLDGFLSLEIE